jgi:hypothetical protein
MKYWLLGILLLTTPLAQAQEIYETARSIRSLGMGGMYIPIVKDNDALYYNPAALGRLEGLNIQLINLNLGVSSLDSDTLETISHIDTNDPTTFNDLFGERIWAGGSAKAGVAIPYFGVGYVSDYQVSLELHNPGFPEFDTYYLNDTSFVIGGAITIGPGAYLGMTLKQTTRQGGTRKDLGLSTVVDGATLDDIADQFDDKGVGYGVDIAWLQELKTPFNPTLTIVWQDVGNTAFTKTAGTNAPPHIPQNLSAGAAIGIDLPGIDWTVGVEGRHLLDTDIQLGKKLHVGTELSLPFIDLRAGLNQGYFSYGVGLNFLLFRLDAVSYSEELGVYPGQTADNRYMIGLSIDLSFDANFNFQDNNGKKRKLKQRR